ncbi:UNVERIFIED_CONTAM: hypothetical protein FKN15_061290 [Acipenser sinensis]
MLVLAIIAKYGLDQTAMQGESYFSLSLKGGCVVQWLKKWACNQKVPGSNPTSATDSLCDPEQVT